MELTSNEERDRNRHTLEFRNYYRNQVIPKNYSGIVHAAFSFSFLFICILTSLYFIHQSTWAEWLTVPLTLLLANFVEYVAHRIPLHRKIPGMEFVFQIHTHEHHRFFSPRLPQFDNTRDFHTVFFPMFAPVVAVIGLSLLGKFLLLPLFSTNVALFFTASGAFYFTLYEAFHFLHHVPLKTKEFECKPRTFTQWMRRHHSLHHEPRLMGKYNFNVVIPIFDFIFGTYTSQVPTQ